MMNETFLISNFYDGILIRSIGLTSNTDENDYFQYFYTSPNQIFLRLFLGSSVITSTTKIEVKKIILSVKEIPALF